MVEVKKSSIEQPRPASDVESSGGNLFRQHQKKTLNHSTLGIGLRRRGVEYAEWEA